MAEKILIAYVPVIHEGYRKLFEKYKDATLFILGQELLNEFDHIKRGKDVRLLLPEDARKLIEAWGVIREVKIADVRALQSLVHSHAEIIGAKDDLLEDLFVKYIPNKKVTWDTTFLRWEKKNTSGETVVTPNQEISNEQFDKEMIALAEEESQKSTDWWRKIGAVLVKDGKIVLTKHNEYLPSQHTPYLEGDPRSNFTAGIHPELSLVLHAEAAIVAQAARKGIALEGASLYCTTFPCPPCAKQVAYSGIKKIYYKDGYANLDGERILKDKGVEIIHVELDK